MFISFPRHNQTVTVKEIMDTWTLKMNYPVVTLSRPYGGGRDTVTQVRRKFVFLKVQLTFPHFG